MTQTEALKLALEAYEIEQSTENHGALMCAIKEALAQPEQEPVGEAYLCDRCHTPFDGAYECPSCGHGEATKEPVYTTPPQRTWVGLTDEDKKEYVSQDFGGNRLDAIDWAEKRLKEKNTRNGGCS